MKRMAISYEILDIKNERGEGFRIEFQVEGSPNIDTQIYYDVGEEKKKKVIAKLDEHISKRKELIENGISTNSLDWVSMLSDAEKIIFYDE